MMPSGVMLPITMNFFFFSSDLPLYRSVNVGAMILVQGGDFGAKILLSETPEGLQHALEKVNDYCENWLLKINADKTKVMIFNKSGRLVKEKFTLGDDLLENVNSYTYLGLEFVPSVSFKPAMETLCKKSIKSNV